LELHCTGHFQQQNLTTKPSLSEGGTASLLVNYVGNGTIDAFPTVCYFIRLERHRASRERSAHRLVQGKVAVFLLKPNRGGKLALAHWTDGHQLSRASPRLEYAADRQPDLPTRATSRSLMTLLVAWLAAWLLLQFRGTTSLILAGTAIAIYGALILLALVAAHLVLPLAMPLTAACWCSSAQPFGATLPLISG